MERRKNDTGGLIRNSTATLSVPLLIVIVAMLRSMRYKYAIFEDCMGADMCSRVILIRIGDI
jgi:hypothetical protein